MPEEKVVDAVAQDQIFKDYVKREKDSVTQWVRAFDFMLSEESLVGFSFTEFLLKILRKKRKGILKQHQRKIRMF